MIPIIPHSTQKDDKPSGSDDKVSKPNRFFIAKTLEEEEEVAIMKIVRK